MIKFLSRTKYSATLVFDAQDAYLCSLGFAGETPRPMGRLEFDIIAEQIGIDFEPLAAPLRLRTVRTASGYYAFFDGLRPSTRSDGLADAATRITLPPGVYQVRVAGEYYQPLVLTKVRVPMADLREPVKADMLPGPTYPFPAGQQASGLKGPTLLRGAVRDADGRGRANIEIAVTVAGGKKTAFTDETGQWIAVIDDPPPPDDDAAPPPIPADVVLTDLSDPRNPQELARRHVTLKPGETNGFPRI